MIEENKLAKIEDIDISTALQMFQSGLLSLQYMHYKETESYRSILSYPIEDTFYKSPSSCKEDSTLTSGTDVP
jgi:hypothetical protein